ncbi:MAG: redoxin domain-containing protein, partial [Candidatus Omnitrophica bacterium]|nr:redoxin domain-containing protein [Candidatus Omnitrophota bacterium]
MSRFVRCLCFVFAMICVFYAEGGARNCQDALYSPGKMLKPVDSVLKVALGDPAIDFSLPSISGKKVSLRDYLGEKNIVLAFIPAAWMPVCSDQIYEYTFYEDSFREQNAVLLVISIRAIPT